MKYNYCTMVYAIGTQPEKQIVNGGKTSGNNLKKKRRKQKVPILKKK